MAQLRNFQDVKDWLRDNGITRWNVAQSRNSGQSNDKVFVSDSEKSEGENLALCERALQRFAGNLIYITGFRGNSNTAGFLAEIQYDAPAQAAQPVAVAGVGETIDRQQLITDIRREIKNEFDQERLERERKEFDEAKRDFEAKQNGVVGLLVQYLAPVAQQLAGKLQPLNRVAGLDATQPVTAQPIRARRPDSEDPAEEELPKTDAYEHEEEVFSEEEADQLFALL